MPESSPGPEHCGTAAAGWLTTTHPTTINQPKQAKVCFHWDSNDCYVSQNIVVNNCGDFYVYYLQETPICKLRYCGADHTTTSVGSTATTAQPTTIVTATNVGSMNTTGCDDYFSLTDGTRNVDHGGSPYYCDNLDDPHTYVSPGWKGSNWYRFTEGAGVVMPESSPGPEHCGTAAAGWLTTTHPTTINQPKQ